MVVIQIAALVPRQSDQSYLYTDDRRPHIVVASTVGLVLSIGGVFLRVLARWKIGAAVKADDYWIYAGLVGLYGQSHCPPTLC